MGAEGATGPMGAMGATGTEGPSGPMGAMGTPGSSSGGLPTSPSPIPHYVLTTDGNNASWDDVRDVLSKGDDAGLLVQGTYTGTPGTPPVSGAGARMMWYPRKAAFRAGSVTGTQWDDPNIGDYSVALGFSSTASGRYSTALGASNASAQNSTALGASLATGDLSTAMGDSIANGVQSVAMGIATANGNHSTAMGGATAGSYYETALGQYNVVSSANPTTWVATDPLFTVGNGTDPGNLSNAFQILKNGTTTVNGSTAVNGTVSLNTSGTTKNLRLGNSTSSTNWDLYSFNDSNFYINNAGGTRLAILDNGNVGIGNITATHNLGVTGTIMATVSVASGGTPDLAETIAAEDGVEAADVVCADRRHRERAVRCGGREAGPLLGVISDGSSSFLINSRAGRESAPLTGKPLVLAGRVPVKVSTENGPIAIGDWLAPSSQAGVAMRASGPGPVVGIALESSSQKRGTVLCFVKVGESGGAELVAKLARENDELRERNRAMEEKLAHQDAELRARVERLEEVLQKLASATPARPARLAAK
jgi:hypothetical protein